MLCCLFSTWNAFCVFYSRLICRYSFCRPFVLKIGWRCPLLPEFEIFCSRSRRPSVGSPPDSILASREMRNIETRISTIYVFQYYAYDVIGVTSGTKQAAGVVICNLQFATAVENHIFVPGSSISVKFKRCSRLIKWWKALSYYHESDFVLVFFRYQVRWQLRWTKKDMLVKMLKSEAETCLQNTIRSS